MNPTAQQQAFIDAMTGSTSHLALVARAGCGKTSTILMAVDAVRKANPRAEIAIMAFNKAISEEIKGKLEKAGHDWRAVQAGTAHSMGLALVHNAFGRNIKIDAKKVTKLIEEMNNPFYKEFASQIASLVSYGKNEGFGFFNAIEDHAAWFDMASHYNVNGLDDTSMMDEIISAAIIIYRRSLQLTSVIDFDDMILFPLVKNIAVRFPKDIVIVDEAQDLNKSKQALIRKFIRRGTGRIALVGDDRQAIYGFSGADANALNNMINELNATALPLSVTWRCPKAVVKVAQGIVHDIEAAPSAKEGRVIHAANVPTDLVPGNDAILCRNMAPLVTLAYSLLLKGIACKVEGREIGNGLCALVRRFKVRTIDDLLTKLSDYKEREIQKAVAKNDERKAEAVDDKVSTIEEIANKCLLDGKKEVEAVIAFIDNLFADAARNVVTLATYHRAKGREWPRVTLFEHSKRCPSKAARKQWEFEQEDNLAYVAITRAQETLIFT